MDAAEAKTRYAEAKRLHAAGQHADALALLDAVDTAHPNSKNVLLAKAECLLALGDRGGAARLCEAVLARREDERARRMLAACAPGSPGDPPAPMAPPPPLPARRSRRLWITVPLLLLLGAGAIGIAVEIVRRQMNPGEVSPAFSDADFAGAAQQREATRAEAARREEALRAEEAATEEAAREAARQKPGYEIPEAEWNLDPVTGGPAWRPGIYRQLPCMGSWFEFAQGPRTIDVYIPMAYAADESRLFPVLAVTMPDLNSGFRGYEAWAERSDVIVVAINSSCNDCSVASNREAQLAAYEFLLAAGLRTHPNLTITTGMSGGAQMAWIAAYNSPEMIAGVLMVAHGGYRDMILPPTTRVAFVNGQTDWNATFIAEMIGRLRANGSEVRQQTIPGGHIEGPIDVRTRMLDWLLDAAMQDLAAAGDAGNY